MKVFNDFKITKNLKKENGAVMVVEAVFVFPVMFFVIFLMIYLGNMLYQQSKMDTIAVRGAQYLASIYANPLLQKKDIPIKSTEINVQPYRYLSTGSFAEDKTKEYIKEMINSTGTGLLSGMEMDARIKKCEISNYVIYQTATVEIEYSINLLPLKFFDISPTQKSSVATTVAAMDPSEFIRNIDMIMDYSEEFGLTDKIKKMVGAFKGN